jgi:hypothetical protein
MDIVDKPAVLISWPRELDMFSVFIKKVLVDAVVVVDDFIYTENEKFENGKNIITLLEGKTEYVLLSEIIGRVKYKTLFSTGGQTFQKRVTFSSYFKYFYANSIGRFIDFFELQKFFLNTIGQPLTGGGRSAEKFGKYPIERIIGDTVVKFPKGLDINKLIYPNTQWKDLFDIYLCHSNIDKNLIVNKFSAAKCIKIGYPRYDYLPSIKNAKKIIYDEIKSIDAAKPLLLWIPTFTQIKGEIIDNIEVWAPIIKKLLKKYNVIIRLHPKSVVTTNPEAINCLVKAGFLVDTKKSRNLGILYQSSDLVLADYGGPVLGAVYMKKKLILLNSPSEKIIFWRKKRMYIDDDVRKDVYAFNIDSGMNLTKQIGKIIRDKDDLKRNELKYKYFGKECSYENLREIFNKLINNDPVN